MQVVSNTAGNIAELYYNHVNSSCNIPNYYDRITYAAHKSDLLHSKQIASPKYLLSRPYKFLKQH